MITRPSVSFISGLSLTTDVNLALPVSITVETYYPVFDDQEEGSLRYKGDNIKNFYTNIVNQSGGIIDIHKLLDNGKFNGTRNKDNTNIFDKIIIR